MNLTDHKTLGRWHLVTAACFFAFAGGLAMLMRWQLGWPGRELPIIGNILPSLKAAGGIIPPEVYAQFFSQHGTIMIFYVVIPVLTGGFATFLLPLMIGARNLAFPRLAASSYAVHLAGGILLLASHFMPTGAGSTGWTAYPPLSAAPGFGQDLWVIALLLNGAGAVMLAISHIATAVHLRVKGMTWFRLPIAVWSFLTTAALVVLSTPALLAALLLLMFDRHAGTSFYVPPGTVISGATIGAEMNVGQPTFARAIGQPLLWQHLFWFYAHPAVYVMILPAMGLVSEIIPTNARRPLFGYGGFVVSICAIAALGFVVWGHHMFVSGMNPYLGAAFAIASFTIAIPSSVETFNWIATLWRSRPRLTTPMLHALAFVATFVIGGMSGVMQASTPIDTHVHNTYFVVAHIHYVLFGGTLFALFGALAHWFPKFAGRLLDERLGKWHFGLTFVAFNLTFFPMHILGLRGMGRRMYDPTVYESLRPLQPINVLISLSAFALGCAQLLLLVSLFLAWRRAPWKMGGLIASIGTAAAVAALVPALAHLAGITSGVGVISGVVGALVLAIEANSRFTKRADLGVDAPENPWQATTLEWSPQSEDRDMDRMVVREPYAYGIDAPNGLDFLPQWDAASERADQASH